MENFKDLLGTNALAYFRTSVTK